MGASSGCSGCLLDTFLAVAKDPGHTGGTLSLSRLQDGSLAL